MMRCNGALLILSALAALVGYLSVAPWLQTVPRVLVPLSLIWLLVSRGRHLLGSRVATALAVVFFLFSALRVPASGFVASSLSFLASLLALRLAADKGPRQHLQICALALFLLAASSLFTLSPLFLPALAAILFLVTLVLMLLAVAHHDAQMLLERAAMKRILLSALAMELVALPLMVLLFLILPRTQYPLWRFVAPSTTAEIGFSESVRPGSVSQIDAVREPVFRVEMVPVPPETLYWRGIVLNTLEGTAWVRKEPPPAPASQAPRGDQVRQVIHLEPSQTPYLFGLDVPSSWGRVRFQTSSDRVARLQSAPVKRLQYEVLSEPGRPIALREQDADFYRRLPDNLSPRLADLAEGVIRDARGDAERLQFLERRFRQLNLVYDVKGMPVTGDPLENFLFEGKRGNCEFFAASYALLLRRVGFPSRLVGGYYGGAYNEVGRYYLVTRDLAHIWVEVYRDEKGWQRIDPSSWAASFPGRQTAHDGSLVSRARLYLDAAAHLWQSKVVPFDLDRQVGGALVVRDLLKRFGLLSQEVWVPVALVGLLMALAVIFRGRLPRLSWQRPEARLLSRMERRLRAEDPTLPPLSRCGLYRFARLSGNDAARNFAEHYGGVVYRDRHFSPEDLEYLRQLLRAI